MNETNQTFAPSSDRTARDIRNRLWMALASDLAPFKSQKDRYRLPGCMCCLGGNHPAARGLADRGRRNLMGGKDHLDCMANLEQLVECLENLSQPPPRLVSSSR